MTELELLTPSKIIRSNRKSISLCVDLSGNFIVRAPIKVSELQIHKFIVKKADWIIKKRTEHLTNKKHFPLTFAMEEKIYILGKPYTLTYSNTQRIKVADNTIEVPQIKSKEKLIAYLKKVSKEHISSLIADISLKTGLTFKSLSISSARTNWGSCSYDNKLHFSYKLIMCPESVVYYIVCHELAHTIVKNHSRKFYNEVAHLCPNYKESEKWLKENKEIITVI